MPVDREQWAESFVALPHWKCPTCRKGTLIPIAEKLLNEETGPSRAAHSMDDWEPDWVWGRFVALMQCNAPACGEVASLSGSSSVDWHETYTDFGGEQWHEDRYTVRSIEPCPVPIVIPAATPEAVTDSIGVAAALTWASAEAAGNQLRQAVELFMDDVGVPSLSSSGKRLSLHTRIGKFQAIDPENGDVLLAVKWLGNSGSHPGGLTRSDVLDAFDMIEYVLESRYGTAKKALLAKVQAVNAKKGPLKKP